MLKLSARFLTAVLAAVCLLNSVNAWAADNSRSSLRFAPQVDNRDGQPAGDRLVSAAHAFTEFSRHTAARTAVRNRADNFNMIVLLTNTFAMWIVMQS